MNEHIKEYLKKYPIEIVDLFNGLRRIIYDSAGSEPREALWGGLPSYYVEEAFIRLIPFKDHINIEAKNISKHKEALSDYKITPKGMLQIFSDQNIPADVLMQIFAETLE